MCHNEINTDCHILSLPDPLPVGKRFCVTKILNVVPSVAIKEGVYKTLQITEAHFKGLYSGQPFDYFLYDYAKLGQVRNFATSPTIQIMVVTVGAINKNDVNNLYKDIEKKNGRESCMESACR